MSEENVYIHAWEDVIAFAGNKKRPAVFELTEIRKSGNQTLKIFGRAGWCSSSDGEIDMIIAPSDIHKFIGRNKSITIFLKNKKFPHIEIRFKNNQIKNKCFNLLSEYIRPYKDKTIKVQESSGTKNNLMPNEIDSILLNIGNDTVKSIENDYLTQSTMPKGAWQISFTVKNSSLFFNVHLDYDTFIQSFAGQLADPPTWITLIGLFSSTSLQEHASGLPSDLNIKILVNSIIPIEKPWVASYNIKDLLSAQKEAKGKTLDEALVIMMTTMQLESR